MVVEALQQLILGKRAEALRASRGNRVESGMGTAANRGVAGRAASWLG